MSAAARAFLAAEAAIRERGQLRGDTPADVEELIDELRRQPDHVLHDLAAHFGAELAVWREATGAGRTYDHFRQPLACRKRSASGAGNQFHNLPAEPAST